MTTYRTELTSFLKLINKTTIVTILMLKIHRTTTILLKDNSKQREATYSSRKLEPELMPISNLLLETLEIQYQRV
jgi:hypothetical protein